MPMSRLILLAALGLNLGCGSKADQDSIPISSPSQQTAKTKSAKTRIAPPPEKQLGMNLGGIVDWSSEIPFVDVFKTSRAWMENGDGPFTYDDKGNPILRPGQSVETLIFRGLEGFYPPGDYVATYDGTGEVEITHWDVDAVLKRQKGRIEFRVKPADGGILVRVRSSAARDPIRNIQVWIPGRENQESPFNAPFLERLKPFPVFRFMDWQRTNNSPVFNWSQRARLDDVRWSTDNGVPPEIMIALANAANVSPWFCIPHQADDEYVREFAQLVKKRLKPSLKIHIEYSNEVWNWGFQQTGFALVRGKKLKLGPPEQLRFYALRSVQVFDIFTEVFGGNDRLVRILSGQFANPSDCETMMKYNESYKKADAFAVGAYFGYEFGSPKTANATAKLTPEQLLDKLTREIDGPHLELIRRHAKLAQKYGLHLMAYEGGQHLAGHGGAENNEALTKLFMTANRHPRMADLYRKQLEHWFAEGGSTFAAFSYVGRPSKWGMWGVLEYQDQSPNEAPRYRALVEVANSLANGAKP